MHRSNSGEFEQEMRPASASQKTYTNLEIERKYHLSYFFILVVAKKLFKKSRK